MYQEHFRSSELNVESFTPEYIILQFVVRGTVKICHSCTRSHEHKQRKIFPV